MDADTTRHKGSHDRLFKQFRSGKADVLIGTQMIAKGLHFPSVTLVGVLNPDGALNLPDFRASEGVFQLVTQVAGRSGRGELPGEVILQTTLPGHPILTFASKEDFAGFYKEEIEVRKAFSYPPFEKLAKLTFTGKDEKGVERLANSYRDTLLKMLPAHYTLYPIIPSGYAKIQDRYRFKLLIKGKGIASLSSALKKLTEEKPLPRSVRLLIDIDPLSTFH